MAAMTLIQLVAAFTAERGLAVPATAASNADRQITQIVGLLNAFNRDMLTRKAFQQNTTEATFVTTATEDQGSIDTIAPSGFEGIMLDTVFNRTMRLPMAGGVTPAEWQTRKALNFTGPLYQFRIRNNRLLMIPTPTAGQTIAFEYLSSFFVSEAGGALKKFWTLDSDYSILGDELPQAYLAWAWPKTKGFEYAEDFMAYERLVAAKLGRSNAPKPASLSGDSTSLRPGIVVSPGSWPL